jgi:hypothetical protein
MYGMAWHGMEELCMRRRMGWNGGSGIGIGRWNWDEKIKLRKPLSFCYLIYDVPSNYCYCCCVICL